MGHEGLLDAFAMLAYDLGLVECSPRNGFKGVLDEVRHETGVRTVLEYGGWPGPIPRGHPPSKSHMPNVETAFAWILTRSVGIGLPELDAGIEIPNSIVVAPLDDFDAVDVPGEVHQDVVRTQMGTQDVAKISRFDSVLHVGDTDVE